MPGALTTNYPVNEGSASLPVPWVEWVARNLMRGVPETDLIAGLVEEGLPITAADEAVRRIVASPIFTALKPMARRLRTLEAMLDVRLSLANQSKAAASIPRRSGLDADAFHSEFYSRNLPVVITDVVRQLPAFSRWTLDYFRHWFGLEVVELQANRRSEPVYEVFLKGHTLRMCIGEFLDRIEQGGPSNQYYLTANDRLLENPKFARLLEDIRPFPKYFKPDVESGKHFIWIGSEGCVSPLHRDRLNVFMMQVSGRKRILMIDSTATHAMYNFESFFSEVDAECPNFDQFPDFRKARILEVTLEPGEALLIPANWWHHVRSLEPSINVSLTNFAFPNNFEEIFDRGIELG